MRSEPIPPRRTVEVSGTAEIVPSMVKFSSEKSPGVTNGIGIAVTVNVALPPSVTLAEKSGPLVKVEMPTVPVPPLDTASVPTRVSFKATNMPS